MKGVRKSIIVNIILIVIVSFAIVIGIAFALNHYTRHGESIIIPEIKGLQIDEAAKKLNEVNLSYEVIDSVYTDKVSPGAVFETLPNEGIGVKKGRTIYVTINAKSPMKVKIPDVENISVRQAVAQLNAMKVLNIQIKEVPGDFDDLCLRIETKSGMIISPNSKINIDTPIVLVVSKKSVRDSALITPDVNVDDEWL